MTTKMKIDGLYFLHPEGSAWIAAIFRDGKLIDTTEQSLAGTHAAASDSWADVVPTDDDIDVDAETASVIVAEVMGEGTVADMVIVQMSS